MKKDSMQKILIGLCFSLLLMIGFTHQATADSLTFTEYGDFSTYSSKVYEDDVVYGYKGTSLVKMDIYGQVLWETTSNQGNFTGDIGLYDDYLSVGTDKGVAYFFNPNNGKVKQFFTVPTNGSSVTGAYIDQKGQINALSGSVIYVLRPNGTFISKSKYYASSILELNSEYMVLSSATNYGYFYWVNPNDLSEISSEYFSGFESIDKKSNKMYTSSGTTLTAYQLNNGRELWSKKFGGGSSINAVTTDPDGTVYVGMESGNFYAVNPITRDIKWQFNEGTPSWGHAVVDSKGNIYVGQSNSSVNQHYIFKFNSEGKKLGIVQIPVQAYELQIREDDSLYFISGGDYYSSDIPKIEKPIEPPVAEGFIEWEHKKNTPVDKMWDVTYNLAIDITTIREKNMYVTDNAGNIISMLYVIDRSKNDSKISIIPVKDYTKGQTYTMWIKDIKAEGGKVQKENIKMNFTIVK